MAPAPKQGVPGFVREFVGSEPQQAAEGNQNVEKPFRLNYRGKVSVIHQHRAHRFAARRSETPHLFRNLLDHLMAYLALTLDLDNIVAVMRLYQHVNLYAALAAAKPAERCRRFDKRISEMKPFDDFRTVVHDHVLKLKTNYRIPSGKTVNRHEKI